MDFRRPGPWVVGGARLASWFPGFLCCLLDGGSRLPLELPWLVSFSLAYLLGGHYGGMSSKQQGGLDWGSHFRIGSWHNVVHSV